MAREIGRVSFDDHTYEPIIRFEKYENGDKVIYTKSGKYCVHYEVEQIEGTELLRKEAKFYKSVEHVDDVLGPVEEWLPCNNRIVRIEFFP